MRVAIAGAHGQVATRLARLLVDRGDDVIGLVRNAAHAEDLRAAGVVPAICDLEHATVDRIAPVVSGSDAVVFAAGAGPGSSAARKLTMDRDGAIELLNATAADASHYMMLSGIGVENPPGGDDVFSVYLRAKADADTAVMASDRDWTIVRPGRLTDDRATGQVRVAAAPFHGEIPRDDLAAVLAGVLHDPRSKNHILYVNSGDEPAAIPYGRLFAVGIGNSVIDPVGVIRPILFPSNSVTTRRRPGRPRPVCSRPLRRAARASRDRRRTPSAVRSHRARSRRRWRALSGLPVVRLRPVLALVVLVQNRRVERGRARL